MHKTAKFELGAVQKRANLVNLEKYNYVTLAFSCKNRLRHSRERTLQNLGYRYTGIPV